MGDRVAAAAATVGYLGAGTVEFLRTAEGELYFMELNARLQVEHPVTEMRYGDLDLVEAQLRVACGEALPESWPGSSPAGHAIEFRINAEDPDDGFRPSPGVVTAMHVPDRDDVVEVRWDSGLREGSRVPPHYDSMIGKLIVRGPDRAGALAGAARVLADVRIDGVATTVGLHRRILDHDPFREGRMDVRSLDRWLEAGL